MTDEPRTSDPVENLLAEILELEDEAQRAAFEDLCTRHPELAGELREHYALYLKLVAEEIPAPSERFGDYDLIRPLGSGGMGVVWLARQQREGADRTVALKLIRGGGLRSPAARERFRREARAAFRIEHSGICPVYDVGEVDGTPYLAMRHVPGRSLADWIADARAQHRPLELPGTGSTASEATTTRAGGRPLDGVLALVESVARALHAAHEAGLVHRDVKPGNIMVTPAGDPVLLDFGLARDAAEESSLTLSGEPLGTPAYMSPEQIDGRGRTVDRTVDVYGLGATLYECVTLEPPFKAETREGLYRKILDEDPRPASRIVRSIPKDLDAILETALHKQPERRYRSTLDFADDLRALRRLEPVRARAAGRVERIALWVRRNPFASTMLALLAGALVFAVLQGRRAADRADEAQRARLRAERGFTLARGAIEELVLAARDHLRDVPQMQPVRADLLDRALEFHETLALELGDDPEVLADASRAWQAVADLRSELGRFEGAREATARAVEIAQERLRLERTPAARLGLADAEMTRGLVESNAGAIGNAITALASSLRRYAELDEPPTALESRGQVRGAIVLAGVLHRAGRTAEAIERLDEAESLIELAAARHPNAVTLLEERATLASRRARIARDFQRFEDAEPAFEVAVASLRRLMEHDPHARSQRAELATTLLARGRMRAREGLYAESLRDIEEAIDLLEKLLAAFPDHSRYAGSLATAWNNRYTVLARLDRPEDAAASLHDARELLETVTSAAPLVGDGLEDLAIVLFNLGNLTRRQEGPAAALRHYERSLALLERVEVAQPGDLEVVRRAASSAEAVAICHLLAGREDLADPLLDHARQRLESVVAKTPDDPRVLRDLGRLRFNQAARAFEDARAADAAALLRDCVTLRSELSAASPENLRLLHDDVLARSRLAVVLLEIDFAAAGATAHSALADFGSRPAELIERARQDGQVRASLGSLHLVAADAAERAGDAAALREHLEQAWDALRAARDEPQIGGWSRVDALLAAVWRAELALGAGQEDDLAHHLADAIAVARPLAESAPLARDSRRAAVPRLTRLQAVMHQAGLDDPEAHSAIAAAREAVTDSTGSNR